VRISVDDIADKSAGETAHVSMGDIANKNARASGDTLAKPGAARVSVGIIANQTASPGITSAKAGAAGVNADHTTEDVANKGNNI